MKFFFVIFVCKINTSRTVHKCREWARRGN